MAKQISEFTKYERARIIGARALQISMDAPVLLDLTEEEVESLNYDSLRIAQEELDRGVLPISINRPLPEKRKTKLKEVKKEVVPEGEVKEQETKVEESDEIVKELAIDLESEDDESEEKNSDLE